MKEALQRYGKPELFNTDQGSRYTSKDFTDILKDNGIDISMDGRGRALDNVFVERLWRTVKYEERPHQGPWLHDAFGSILRSRYREAGQLLREQKQKNQGILKREKGQQTTGPITLFSPPSGPVSREYLTAKRSRALIKGKIAFFIPSCRGGGAERVMVTFANAFARKGIETDLVVCSLTGPYVDEVDKSVNIIDLGTRKVSRSVFSLLRYFRENKPAAIIFSQALATINL